MIWSAFGCCCRFSLITSLIWDLARILFQGLWTALLGERALSLHRLIACYVNSKRQPLVYEKAVRCSTHIGFLVLFLLCVLMPSLSPEDYRMDQTAAAAAAAGKFEHWSEYSSLIGVHGRKYGWSWPTTQRVTIVRKIEHLCSETPVSMLSFVLSLNEADMRGHKILLSNLPSHVFVPHPLPWLFSRDDTRCQCLSCQGQPCWMIVMQVPQLCYKHCST